MNGKLAKNIRRKVDKTLIESKRAIVTDWLHAICHAPLRVRGRVAVRILLKRAKALRLQ